MEARISPGNYFQYAPAGVHGSLRRSASLTDRERYLAELFEERQKLGSFAQILPLCSRLLSQEIVRASGLYHKVSELERAGNDYHFRSFSEQPNGGRINTMEWTVMQTDEDKLLQKMDPFQPSALNWHAAIGTPATPVVKRVIRLDIPVEKYPNYNFVGRILGPRGNSLKRVEAMTECRIYIRGRGSIKDSVKEDKLKDKPGYEHLNELLHLLVEAEFPEDIIDGRIDHAVAVLENLLKPVDESMDAYKKQQLRELAMLNGTFREESPSMSPSMSPFNSTGMKRAKTGI
ncbi:KH domain-containing protein At1g09660/At1g09670 [Andrographis paniculata]|uniref:KH domain-containing protein At1g09660/At1g09670 n=1 Tax=Andrographis paniculata TaxID=175694 RepID=UPI0021E6F5A6|nr:KH domain-containing protein At1g09660/At1g09670 [Andrographis paniculata]XP_051145418.1 KH domain-containing protein At1g09660/At1g09670 [Andrographis paniculata]